MNEYTVSSDKPFPEDDPETAMNRHERRKARAQRGAGQVHTWQPWRRATPRKKKG